jgi:hypothetical protein
MLIELGPIGDIRPYENTPGLSDDAVAAVTMSPRAAELWAPVPGYEGLYDVSSYGRVRRSSKSRMAPAGHVLKPHVTRDGYLRYGLCKRRRYWHVKAHRLVALAFLGPPPFPGAHVAHFDGNKRNNHVSNLRWATPKENEADKRRHGRVGGARPGERHPMAKLTTDVVKEMRRLAASGMSFKAVAGRFGVANLTAYDAIVGTTWKTVTEPPPVPRQRRMAS